MGSDAQQVNRYQQGMEVYSRLLQGGTITALLELVIGTSHMQTSLTRMQRLMQNQQQYLQQMLMHRQHPRNKLPVTHQPPATSVKTELQAVLQPSNAAASVKLEEQAQEQKNLGSVPDVLTAPAESGISQRPTQIQEGQTPGRRRRQHDLAWHVVSSGVVQIAYAGLRHTVLEVRPPPPWSLAAPSQTAPALDPHLESSAADTNVKPDTVMLDAQQPATAPQSVKLPLGHQAQDTLPTAGKSFQPPGPVLTLHMQWQLIPHQASDQASDSTIELRSHLPFAAAAATQQSSPGLPPSQGLAVPASQALHQPQNLPASQGQQQLAAGPSPDDSKEQSGSAGLARQQMPTLRCCMTSEPQLPLQVLESFEDMAGVLIYTPLHFVFPDAHGDLFLSVTGLCATSMFICCQSCDVVVPCF